MGGVMFDGSVNATTQRYLGSYSFLLSDDAAGTFTIGARRGDTFVVDSYQAQVPFQAAPGMITVGTR